MPYTTAANKCPGCGYTFRTMADEFGTHACPRCSFAQVYEMCEGCGYKHPEHELQAVWTNERGLELFCPDCWEGE